MSKRASIVVAVVCLVGVALAWAGGGWLWRQLLAMHGKH
jgi:hypothetical protein